MIEVRVPSIRGVTVLQAPYLKLKIFKLAI